MCCFVKFNLQQFSDGQLNNMLESTSRCLISGHWRYRLQENTGIRKQAVNDLLETFILYIFLVLKLTNIFFYKKNNHTTPAIRYEFDCLQQRIDHTI